MATSHREVDKPQGSYFSVHREVDNAQRSTFSARPYLLHPRHWPVWFLLGLLRLVGGLPWRAQQRLGACLGFGVNTASLNSTAVLCSRTGATVVPVNLVRMTAARPGYRLEILPALEDFPSGDDHRDRCRTNDLMESMIRRAPEQYMWILRRFRVLADGTRPYGGPRHSRGLSH